MGLRADASSSLIVIVDDSLYANLSLIFLPRIHQRAPWDRAPYVAHEMDTLPHLVLVSLCTLFF